MWLRADTWLPMSAPLAAFLHGHILVGNPSTPYDWPLAERMTFTEWFHAWLDHQLQSARNLPPGKR